MKKKHEYGWHREKKKGHKNKNETRVRNTTIINSAEKEETKRNEARLGEFESFLS